MLKIELLPADRKWRKNVKPDLHQGAACIKEARVKLIVTTTINPALAPSVA